MPGPPKKKKDPCSEPACDRLAYAFGICQLHYHRRTRGYDPLHIRILPLRERLERRTLYADDGCWLWEGSHDQHGYGKIEYPTGKKVFVHRVGYELLVGPIPGGLVIDHLCRVHNCWNPAHLEPVTSEENVRRGIGRLHNILKTHCPRGHPYDEKNTYITASGGRACKTCTAVASRDAMRKAADRIETTCLDCGVKLRTPTSKRCRSCAARHHNQLRRATSGG